MNPKRSRLYRFLDSCHRCCDMFERQGEYVNSIHSLADPLKTTAALRARIHVGNGADFKRAYDQHYVGLKGEEAFSQAFQEPLVLWDQPNGDCGEDFWIPLFVDGASVESFSVDVKTSRQGSAIIVPKGKVRADLYVLAQYDDETDTARLIGWQWAAIVKNSPTRKFNQECHYCTAIRPLAELAHNSLWLGNDSQSIPKEWLAVRLVESH